MFAEAAEGRGYTQAAAAKMQDATFKFFVWRCSLMTQTMSRGGRGGGGWGGWGENGMVRKDVLRPSSTHNMIY